MTFDLRTFDPLFPTICRYAGITPSSTTGRVTPDSERVRAAAREGLRNDLNEIWKQNPNSFLAKACERHSFGDSFLRRVFILLNKAKAVLSPEERERLEVGKLRQFAAEGDLDRLNAIGNAITNQRALNFISAFELLAQRSERAKQIFDSAAYLPPLERIHLLRRWLRTGPALLVNPPFSQDDLSSLRSIPVEYLHIIDLGEFENTLATAANLNDVEFVEAALKDRRSSRCTPYWFNLYGRFHDIRSNRHFEVINAFFSYWSTNGIQFLGDRILADIYYDVREGFVEKIIEERYCLLREALANGQLELVNTLSAYCNAELVEALSAYCNTNGTLPSHEYFESLLEQAATTGQPEKVKAILAYCNANRIQLYLGVVMLSAAKNGHLEAVKILLDYCHEHRSYSNSSYAALVARENGHSELADFISNTAKKE